MCLLERQTPFFSPPGVWDGLQQYLSLNKTGHSQRAAEGLRACLPAASLVGEEALTVFVNFLCCSCVSHARPEPLTSECYNHILYQIVICLRTNGGQLLHGWRFGYLQESSQRRNSDGVSSVGI